MVDTSVLDNSCEEAIRQVKDALTANQRDVVAAWLYAESRLAAAQPNEPRADLWLNQCADNVQYSAK